MTRIYIHIYICVVPAGSFFGECGLVESALLKHSKRRSRRLRTVRATVDSELGVLPKSGTRMNALLASSISEFILHSVLDLVLLPPTPPPLLLPLPYETMLSWYQSYKLHACVAAVESLWGEWPELRVHLAQFAGQRNVPSSSAKKQVPQSQAGGALLTDNADILAGRMDRLEEVVLSIQKDVKQLVAASERNRR